MPDSAVNTPSQEDPESADKKRGILLAMRGGIADLLRRGGLMQDVESQTESPSRRNSEMREYSEVLRETEVYSIPDVHGDIMALKMSLDAQGLIDARGNWKGGDSVAEFLGDYIDRGDTNLEVLDYLLKLKKQAEAAGGQVDLLLGNHESMLIGSIANISGYRDNWLHPDNGGDKIFEEIREKYKLKSDDEVWEKIKDIFGPKGEYSKLISSMRLVSQVDDVLYVHAGINGEWAETIEDKGIEGVNLMWKSAYSDLMNGKTEGFDNITGKHGPLWIKYGKHIERMSEDEIARIAKSLKKRGINAIVLGHDIMVNGPEMHAGFEMYGIKVIASDVGMFSVYGDVSTQGGVKIDKEGNIEGRSRFGLHILHKEEEPAPESKAA
jgi:hypothetical protein